MSRRVVLLWLLPAVVGAVSVGCGPAPGGGGSTTTTSTTTSTTVGPPPCRTSTDALEFRMDGVSPGTAVGDPEFSGDTPIFAGGQSVALDGNDSFQLDGLDYDSEVSVEAWIKPTALGGLQVLWDDYGNPGVLLKINDAEVEFGISTTQDPGAGIQVAGGTLVEGQWQHVAGVYDGSDLRVYLNGVLVGSASTSGPIAEDPQTPAGLGGGNNNVPDDFFTGLIDDVRIYQRAIDSSELGYVDGQPCVAP